MVDSQFYLQRYLTLKSMTPGERKKVTPRNVFFAGKAAPGCEYLHAIDYFTELNMGRRLYRQASMFDKRDHMR